jgi:hypothetical protein
MEFLHMPKELKWSGIVTLVPNRKVFPHKCGQEDRAVKEAWEGRSPAKWRCDLAQGHFICQATLLNYLFIYLF